MKWEEVAAHAWLNLIPTTNFLIASDIYCIAALVTKFTYNFINIQHNQLDM